MLYAGDADYNCVYHQLPKCLPYRFINANQGLGNWLGGEVVSNEVGQPGFQDSGYINISTPDGIVHGQVKQSGAFSFARIYESGHVSTNSISLDHKVSRKACVGNVRS